MNRQDSAWQRGILRWRYLVVGLLLMLLVFGLVMSGIQRDRADAEEARLQANQVLSQAQLRYDALNAELRQVGSSSYIENIARQYYSFLKKGELRFEITNSDALNAYTYEEMQIYQEEHKAK